MRKLLLRTFWLLFISATLAIVTLGLLAIDEGPLALGDPEVASLGADYAGDLLKALDRRDAPADRIRTLRLSGADVNLLANTASRRFGIATEIALQDHEAIVRVSAPVPTVGGYFNIDALVGDTSTGLPRIESFSVGHVHVPRWIATRAVAFALTRLSDTPLRDIPVDTITAVSFGQGLLSVEYQWQNGLQERIAALAMPKADADRLYEYHERIRLALDELPPESASIVDLARPLMKLAAERSASGDPIAENRAAILALGFYIVGTGPAAIVPAAREWTRALPHTFLLGGSEETTRHFAMSAALAATAGTSLAPVVEKYKDTIESDAEARSPASLAADQAGALLGKMAMQSPDTARRLQSRLATLTEADLMPNLKDLPANLSKSDIVGRFGGSAAAAQGTVMQEISRRLAGMRLFK